MIKFIVKATWHWIRRGKRLNKLNFIFHLFRFNSSKLSYANVLIAMREDCFCGIFERNVIMCTRRYIAWWATRVAWSHNKVPLSEVRTLIVCRKPALQVDTATIRRTMINVGVSPPKWSDRVKLPKSMLSMSPSWRNAICPLTWSEHVVSRVSD